MTLDLELVRDVSEWFAARGEMYGDAGAVGLAALRAATGFRVQPTMAAVGSLKS